MVHTAGIVTKSSDTAMNTITVLIFITIHDAFTFLQRHAHTKFNNNKTLTTHTFWEGNVYCLPTAELAPNIRLFTYFIFDIQNKYNNFHEN